MKKLDLMSILSINAKPTYRAELTSYWNIFRWTGSLLIDSLSNTVQPLQVMRDNAPPLEVVNLDLPNLQATQDQIFVDGVGALTLRNINTTTVKVRVNGTITAFSGSNLAPVGNITSSEVTIASGQQLDLSLSYTLPRSSLIDHTGYFASLSVHYIASGGLFGTLPPLEQHFFVGTDTQLDILRNQRYTVQAQGQLDVSQETSVPFQTMATTRELHTVLTFPNELDEDLHVYDSNGDHVGVNYLTGVVENLIPGATYTGSSAQPEGIGMTQVATEPYQLKVVNRSTLGQAAYHIATIETPALAALLEVSPRITWRYPLDARTATDMKLQFAFAVQENAGTQDMSDVHVTIPVFRDQQGVMIPNIQATCMLGDRIVAGQALIGLCTVQLPAGIDPALFTTTLEVTGRDANAAPVHTQSLITLDLTAFHLTNQIFLPVITLS